MRNYRILGHISVGILIGTSCAGPTTKSRTQHEPQVTLKDLPLLKQPATSVDATGFVQEGRHVEFAALVTNADLHLDGRKATVTLVARGLNGEMLTQRTIELIGIPARTTVAISDAAELDSESKVARVSAFVAFADAAIMHVDRSKPLEASEVVVKVGKFGEVSVVGQLAPDLTFPGCYRVDAVLFDATGSIVGSARSTGVQAIEKRWTRFTARGKARSAANSSGFRAVITIMPVGGKQ